MTMYISTKVFLTAVALAFSLSLVSGSVNLGDTFPDFAANTSKGSVSSFHEGIGDGWAILFSQPADFTPVSTTELALMVNYQQEFQKRDCTVFVYSNDGVDSHKEWAKDVAAYRKSSNEDFPYHIIADFPYHIIADEDGELAVKLGMIDPKDKDKAGLPLTCRAVFIIGPDKRLKLSTLYPATTGHNFDEILRVLDSLQLTFKKKVATPANWQNGGECLVLPSVTDNDASKLFPQYRTAELPSGKDYLRFTPQP